MSTHKLEIDTKTFACTFAGINDFNEEDVQDVVNRLKQHIDLFNPDGWILLECVDMSSSRLGELTILPYGGDATFKSIPTRPVSPRGLASDMATVKYVLPRSTFDQHLTERKVP